MNCAQGDLAVVVRSWAGNEGKIVTCVQLHPAGYKNLLEAIGPVWEIDRALPAVSLLGDVSYIAAIPDVFLRPLRGASGQDETLQWAAIPIEETTCP